MLAPAPLQALFSCMIINPLYCLFSDSINYLSFRFRLNIRTAAPARMIATLHSAVLPSVSLSVTPVFGVSGAFSFTISVSTVCAYATVTCLESATR